MNKLIALALLASGCSILKPRSDPTRYFVLTANDAAPSGAPIATPVGLDHIELPEYLIRDEMVTRKATNQIDIQDYNRWGEPLKEGLVRTLRRDLEGQLGMERVVTPPFEPTQRPALVLDLQIRHFEFVAGQGATLDATWIVRDKTGTAVTTHETKQTVPAPDGDTGAQVSALSKTIASLASEIGESIRANKTASRR